MLKGADPGPSLALTHLKLLDLMRPLPQHMVWIGLGTATMVHYIKLLLTSGMIVVEGAPIPMEHFLRKVGQWGCQLRVSLYKAVIVVGKPQE